MSDDITEEELEELRLERMDREDSKRLLPNLIAGDAWDIIYSYGSVKKATLIAKLINSTEDELRANGTSHDRLTGEIAGVIEMMNCPQTLLNFALQFKEEDKDDNYTTAE